MTSDKIVCLQNKRVNNKTTQNKHGTKLELTKTRPS